MTVFISGGAKCGKSSFAQDLTVALAGNGKRYYVATMIPTGEEDFNRIRRHISDRDGMGFETVECFKDIMTVAKTDGTFLVDSVTSLVQNSLFPTEANVHQPVCGSAEAKIPYGSADGHAYDFSGRRFPALWKIWFFSLAASLVMALPYGELTNL